MNAQNIRRSLPVAAVIAASLLLVACASTPPAVPGPNAPAMSMLPDDQTSAIDDLFTEWNSVDGAGCAVAAMRDGQVIYGRGFGMANLETGTPNSPRTIFHVASVSKQFTAFAIALLEADDKLSVDDEVRTHIPELHDFGHTITIRDIIHHTSGIRDQWDLLILAGWRMDDVITKQDALDLVFAQRELNFAPRDRHLYSNTGYTLLAEIVERVSGVPFPQFCQERMFAPLGMTSTHFHDDHRHIVPGRAECYWRRGDGWQKAVLSYAIAGATSLFTTVEDLAKWQHNFATAQVGGKQVIDRMHEVYVLNNGTEGTYAFGLGIGERNGRRTVGHSGGDAGFACHLVRFPDDNLSVAVLANTPMPTSQLALEVSDIILRGVDEEAARQSAPAQPAADETDANADDIESEAISLSRDELRRFVGRFASVERGIAVSVELRGQQLRGVAPEIPELTLAPIAANRLRLVDVMPGTELEYHFDSDGGVERVTVHQPGGPSFDLAPAEDAAINFAEFTGRYYSPELDVFYDVTADNDGLLLQRRKRGNERLQPIEADRFAGPADIAFTRDEDGAIDGFHISTGRVRNLRFRRGTSSD